MVEEWKKRRRVKWVATEGTLWEALLDTEKDSYSVEDLDEGVVILVVDLGKGCEKGATQSGVALGRRTLAFLKEFLRGLRELRAPTKRYCLEGVRRIGHRPLRPFSQDQSGRCSYWRGVMQDAMGDVLNKTHS